MAKTATIRQLASLLDDPDENIAVNAMAEILYRESELGDLLGELQEKDDPVLRKRVHQLQAALTLRRRRRAFARKLAQKNVDFIDALIDVHLQWFDNDSRPLLEENWRKFLAAAQKREIRSPEDIASFMRKEGFTAEIETTLRPENYCIGLILREKIGSAALLCGICRKLVGDPQNYLVLRNCGDFTLCHASGALLIPAHDWQISRAKSLRDMELFDDRTLLQFASSTLFSAAVNSDSFRYILTIAQALSGRDDDQMLDYLPYPYYPDDGKQEEPQA
ncbi:MAG: hypothetical protein MJ033_00195 [Victivallaceae bacterium]|nr:hypothetical protein [Victivallaceae bacterium]